MNRLFENDLESETGPSRSTVNRAIRGLTDRNWVEEEDRNHYAITSAGEIILQKYDDFSSTIAETQAKTKLLNQLGDSVDDPSIEVFSESTTIDYPAKDPHRGWQRASEEVSKRIEEGFETYWGMNPIVSAAGNDIGQQILAAADEAELIIDEEVFDISRSNYSEAMENGLKAENLDIYVSSEEVTFTLAIYDEEMVEVAAHSGDGHLIAGGHGSDERLVNWATEIYKNYRQQSHSLSELRTVADK